MRIDEMAAGISRIAKALEADTQAGGVDAGTREKLVEVAREFEAMVMFQMLRDMRRSLVSIDGDDDEGAGLGGLGDTLYMEVARHLTKGTGMGLSAALMPSSAAAAAPSGATAVFPLRARAEMRSLASLGRKEPVEPQVASAPPAPAAVLPGRPTRVDLRESPTTAPARPLEGVHAPEAPAAVAAPAHVSRPRPAERIPRPAAAEPPPVETAPVISPHRARPASISIAGEMRAMEPERSRDAAVPLPIEARVTSKFGWRQDPLGAGRRFHGGIDLGAAYGREVPAPASGVVVSAGEQGGYGLTVVVEHPDGIRTRYAHLSSIAVERGEHVAEGTLLGRVGSSGRATGPHLHFEVTQHGRRIDPRAAAANYAALKNDLPGADFPDDPVLRPVSHTGADE